MNVKFACVLQFALISFCLMTVTEADSLPVREALESAIRSSNGEEKMMYLDLRRALEEHQGAFENRLSRAKAINPIVFEALQDSKVIELALSCPRLGEVPPEIFELTKLKKLRLRRLRIQAVPREIERLSQLNELVITGTRITSLPAEIGQLEKLRQLDLRNNEIDAIPAEIGELSSLQYLFLCSNKLTSLPNEIGRLGDLCVLKVTMNKIRSLPEALADPPRLSAIDFFLNPLGDSEVDKLVAIKSLRYLCLEETEVSKKGIRVLRKSLPKCEIDR